MSRENNKKVCIDKWHGKIDDYFKEEFIEEFNNLLNWNNQDKSLGMIKGKQIDYFIHKFLLFDVRSNAKTKGEFRKELERLLAEYNQRIDD